MGGITNSRPAPGARPMPAAHERIAELEEQLLEARAEIERERTRRTREVAAANRRHSENRRTCRALQRRIDELEQQCRDAREESSRLERLVAELRVGLAGEGERRIGESASPRPRPRPKPSA